LAPITRTSKRSLLDAGGIALHWLFGVADSRQMESIHTVIGGLTQRSEGLIHLMDRQLSYINSSISTGNKNSRDIQRLADTLSLLNQKITTVQTHFESTLSSLGPAISHLFSVSSAIRM
jgi:ABC-type transporter Mla subunit MlaD